ncbi:MAG TPA: fumarylacetoacetate hydrolase family protein [Ktedonobacterales bacterium]|jgi:2-keto-4-pentenoate hydratase/2-oxohepta-3-ene-1,7-dioic acid hydratase in catechol pathway
MRLATYRTDGGPRLGVVRDEQIIDVASLAGFAPTITMLDLIEQGQEGLARLRQAITSASAALLQQQGAIYPLTEAHLLAPIPRPRRNIFCLGRNYVEHALESTIARGGSGEVPEDPIFFTKATTTVSGPYDPLWIDPTVSTQMDWEVELGVVMGRSGKNIPAAQALDAIFGYTVINDVSARDLQARHKQWFKGKSLDGSCPMGPWIVTADELADPHALNLRLSVNGVVKQASNTRLLIYNLPVIIETLSAGLTLEAGDIIATGTPAGVGFARQPPEYLQPGDVVEAEVEGIGRLRNPVARLEAGR